MGSFTTYMYNHIALQAKGATIYLTVKEGYIHVSKGSISLQDPCICKYSKHMITKTEKYNELSSLAYQVRFHKYHSRKRHWVQISQPVHVYWQVYYTYGPAIPTTNSNMMLPL